MGPLSRLIGSLIFFFIYRGGNEGVRRRKALKTSPKLPKASQRLPKDSPNVSQSSPKPPKASPKAPPESPRVSQSLPRLILRFKSFPKPPQSLPKAVPKPHWPRMASRLARSSPSGILIKHAKTKIELACRREPQKFLLNLTDNKSPP